MKRTGIRFLAVAVAIVTILASYGCSGETAGPSSTYRPGAVVDEKYAANYQTLLDGSKVIEIDVTIAEAYYQEILIAPEDETFYNADVKIGTDTVTKAGFRTSGNNTDLDSYSEGSEKRFSYKIKFDKYVDKQKYLKLDELYLLNLKNDPSYMRAYIALNAFRAIGGNSPLCSFASLSINGNPQGLYLAVESIDDSFLKRVYGNNDGNLYKSVEGADLLTTSSLALLDQKNGGDTSKADLTNLIRILNEMTDGEKGEIESILDVDSALRYIAVCTVMGIYKSYLSKNPDNFYLAVNNGVFSIFPWKVSSAFGGASKDNGVTVDISPYEPVYRIDMFARPLVEKLLAVEEYCTKYEGYVTAAREYLEKTPEMIETLDALIGEYVKNDATAFYSYDQYLVAIGKGNAEDNTTGIITVKEYADLRNEYLKSVNF